MAAHSTQTQKSPPENGGLTIYIHVRKKSRTGHEMAEMVVTPTGIEPVFQP